MKAYKGFDKDLKCRGFQYEIGKTYEEEEAELCRKGFHACEDPIDCFRYYNPGSGARFCEVEIEDNGQRESEDSKVCGKKITVGAEIGIPGIAKAHFEYVKAHTNFEHTDPKAATAGYRGAATAGDRGAATAGDSGAATAGYRGAATAGDSGAATAGSWGAATAGSWGAATAGSWGAATAGYRGAATAGSWGAATSKGTVSVGENGVGTVRGNGCKIRGGQGAFLTIAEEFTDSSDIEFYKSFIVDGKKYIPDTWYMLKKGEIVEAE